MQDLGDRYASLTPRERELRGVRVERYPLATTRRAFQTFLGQTMCHRTVPSVIKHSRQGNNWLVAQGFPPEVKSLARIY
jgi:hypothetical protein